MHAGEKLSVSNASDVRGLCTTLLNCYLIQLLETGFLHADPHTGLPSDLSSGYERLSSSACHFFSLNLHCLYAASPLFTIWCAQYQACFTASRLVDLNHDDTQQRFRVGSGAERRHLVLWQLFVTSAQ